MKRFINFFVLAGVLAIVATSCYKDDIDNLQKQIDALKSGEIATIETQISSINTSITELKSVDNTLKEYITALQSDSKKYAQQIEELTAMDKTLETKISDLQKYVDSGIKDTKDWASATFATLDQMDSLCAVVATIPPQIKAVQAQLDSVKKEVTGDYTKAIEAAMTKLEASMKKWVSEQLADYYTIAQINATLDSLGKFQSKVDSAMVEKIKEQQAALDTAKIQITAAYKKAIKVAVDSLGGKFDTQIATQIATAKNALQTQITAINTEITDIKSRLAVAEGNIAALVNQIQSIVVIPQYSDGSVSYTGDVDILSFDIYPTSVAQAIATAWQGASAEARKSMVSFKLKEVATKTSGPTATVDTVFFKDNEFKVGVKFESLPDNAMASLHIASGATDVASQYFGLTQTADYFYFEAVNAGAKVALVIPDKKDANPPTAPSLLYSTDGGTNWTDYNIQDTIPAGGLTAGQRIYFKAKTTNTTFGAAGYYDYYYFATTDLVKVGGNIMYLLNGSNPDDANLSPYCFKGLFSPSDGPEGFRQSFIVSASDLKLPAAELSNSCYYRMFASCNMLKTAPATLPATTLKNSCYYGMFNSCVALEAAPALPATKLDTMCYCGMFQSCTTLVSAPVLPAKEMARSCYSQMFDKCYKLVTAPALSATTLAAKCYFKMFCDCIALENPPALDATTLADSCYCNMFTSCSTMVAAPPLPATQLKTDCYKLMFSKCVKLSSVTMLATDVSADNCLKEWLAYGAGTDESVTSRVVKVANADMVGPVSANTPTTWTVTSQDALPEGSLHAVFSVSATKKVRFSKGNLQATCTKAGLEGTSEYSWGFAEHQYDTLGCTSGNVTIADQTIGAKVDLFGWVGASGTLAGNATKYGIAVSSNATKIADFGNVLGEKLKADWGTTIDNDGTWRSLTIDEVGYLFSFKGEEGEGKPDCTNPTRQGLNAYNVTVAGHKNCIVLYPDGFTGTKVSTGDETSYDTPEEWAVAEAQGVVCLPAAGYHIYSNVKFVGEKSFYWTNSSPASGSNNTSAFPFGVGYVIYNNSYRLQGGSVRLVTEVQ